MSSQSSASTPSSGVSIPPVSTRPWTEYSAEQHVATLQRRIAALEEERDLYLRLYISSKNQRNELIRYISEDLRERELIDKNVAIVEKLRIAKEEREAKAQSIYESLRELDQEEAILREHHGSKNNNNNKQD